MTAEYVFRVRFRLDATGVHLDPQTFETVLRLPAVDPADDEDPDGWLFFRDNLWRGNAADERYLRETASDLLGVEFNADSVDEVLTSISAVPSVSSTESSTESVREGRSGAESA